MPKTEYETKSKSTDLPNPSNYKRGKLKYRMEDDSCDYFGDLRCHVSRLQRDQDYDVCGSFCIPLREKQGHKKK